MKTKRITIEITHHSPEEIKDNASHETTYELVEGSPTREEIDGIRSLFTPPTHLRKYL